MRTEEVKIYFYDELPTEDAKKRAREWYREINDMPFLHQDIEGFIVEELDGTGIELVKDLKVYFSLSHSQGDGVMFEGTFTYAGEVFQVKHAGHYYHENSKTITTLSESENDDSLKEFEELYVGVCRKARDHGYALIDYENEDANVAETLVANQYEFTEEGKRWK